MNYYRLVTVCFAILASTTVYAQTFIIDFETPATGSNIVADGSLVTPLGTVTLVQDTPGDASINGFGPFPDDLPIETYGNRLIEAGSDGAVWLVFDFPVTEVSFNLGGDGGGFLAEILDSGDAVLDSISTASLPGSGLAPGPHTFTNNQISALRFEDPVAGAAIDNVEISSDVIGTESVPVPAISSWGLVVLVLAMLGTFALRRKQRVT